MNDQYTDTQQTYALSENVLRTRTLLPISTGDIVLWSKAIRPFDGKAGYSFSVKSGLQTISSQTRSATESGASSPTLALARGKCTPTTLYSKVSRCYPFARPLLLSSPVPSENTTTTTAYQLQAAQDNTTTITCRPRYAWQVLQAACVLGSDRLLHLQFCSSGWQFGSCIPSKRVSDCPIVTMPNRAMIFTDLYLTLAYTSPERNGVQLTERYRNPARESIHTITFCIRSTPSFQAAGVITAQMVGRKLLFPLCASRFTHAVPAMKNRTEERPTLIISSCPYL